MTNANAEEFGRRTVFKQMAMVAGSAPEGLRKLRESRRHATNSLSSERRAPPASEFATGVASSRVPSFFPQFFACASAHLRNRMIAPVLGRAWWHVGRSDERRTAKGEQHADYRMRSIGLRHLAWTRSGTPLWNSCRSQS
jgi:hypothetical protein